MSLSVQRFVGAQVEPHLEAVARLRIQVFREFPYLYDGSLAYEQRYLHTYAEAPDSLFVLVLAGARVVGASTGVPLAQAEAAFQEPFIAHGYPLEQVFYFGESVLLPAYRGQGLGHRFFDEREGYARELGGFTYTAFCAVERPADHPHRPPYYRPLDAFWRRRGYEKFPELVTYYAWQDLDEAEESPKRMTFWLRAGL